MGWSPGEWPASYSARPCPALWHVVAALGIAGCSPTTVDEVLAREGDPGRGELVWRAHCVECHGEDGTGTEEGVDLTDRPISAEDLAQRFLEGRGMMQGLADELSTKQAADVLAWLQAEIVPPE